MIPCRLLVLDFPLVNIVPRAIGQHAIANLLHVIPQGLVVGERDSRLGFLVVIRVAIHEIVDIVRSAFSHTLAEHHIDEFLQGLEKLSIAAGIFPERDFL